MNEQANILEKTFTNHHLKKSILSLKTSGKNGPLASTPSIITPSKNDSKQNKKLHYLPKHRGTKISDLLLVFFKKTSEKEASISSENENISSFFIVFPTLQLSHRP